MIAYPRILVCTDFSPSSDRALKMGAKLARSTTGELMILHVAELGFYLSTSVARILPQDVDKKFTELIHVDLMEQMKAQLKRCEADGRSMVVFESNASRGINKIIDTEKIDLVVMGDKGATGLQNFLLGSLARKTAASAEVPVLIVKRDTEIRKIAALVSDGEEMKKTITLTEEIGRQCGAEICVFSLVSGIPSSYAVYAQEYSSEFVSILERENKKLMGDLRQKIEQTLSSEAAKVVVSEVPPGDIPSQLVTLADEEKVDLVVLNKHHKSWMEKFILGSVSARVLEIFQGNILIC